MSKRFLSALLLLVALRAAFDLAYTWFVAPVFGYEGFKLAFDWGQYVASWLLYLTVFPITPLRLRKVSDAAFMLVTTAIIAPLTSMYGLSGQDVAPVMMSLASMMLVYAIVNFKPFKALRIPYLRMGARLAVIISLAVIVLVVLHYLLSGVHLSLSLTKVYDFRSGNAEIAGGGLFAYMNSWAFQIFCPFVMAVCLMRRRYGALLVLCLIQVFLFAASQHKSALFAPLLIIGVWWYMRRSSSLLIVPAALIVLVGASLLTYLVYHDIMFPSLAIRRTFFTPAHLDFAYFSFFSMHPKVVWGDSFWMPLVHSPYPVTMPYVIGNYLGSPALGANNGFVASGFGQAGVLGVFLYSMILGFALKFVDCESRRLDATWLGVALFLLPILTIWQSSDLATALLTHGFLVMLVLLGLLRRPGMVASPGTLSISSTRCGVDARKLVAGETGDSR